MLSYSTARRWHKALQDLGLMHMGGPAESHRQELLAQVNPTSDLTGWPRAAKHAWST